MRKQCIVVCELSNEESTMVNSQKRNKENYWTHKVVCGEHATFLTIGAREDLARMVIDLWPMVFSGIGNELHPNAKPVEQADRRYLITLEEKFGNPSKMKLKRIEQELKSMGINLNMSSNTEVKPKESFFNKLYSKLFGG
jgi:hypothetical protein